MREAAAEGIDRFVRSDGFCASLFAELIALFVANNGHVCILRRRKAEDFV